MPDVQSDPAGQSKQIGELAVEYYPGGQVEIVPVTNEGQDDPAVHGVQLVAPTFEYVPEAHNTGSLFVVAQKNPFGQVLHSVIPLRDH